MSFPTSAGGDLKVSAVSLSFAVWAGTGMVGSYCLGAVGDRTFSGDREATGERWDANCCW